MWRHQDVSNRYHWYVLANRAVRFLLRNALVAPSRWILCRFRCTSPQLTTPRLTSPLPHHTWFHLSSSLLSSHVVIFPHTKSIRFIALNSVHFFSTHLNSPHVTSLRFFHPTPPHLTPPHSISPYLATALGVCVCSRPCRNLSRCDTNRVQGPNRWNSRHLKTG